MATRARAGKDYDRILGLRPEAAVEEIPKARRLALERHQDRNPRDLHAEERFKEIGEAYAVLIDPAKRRSARHS
jgi:DnaJ-class molecular chaperone